MTWILEASNIFPATKKALHEEELDEWRGSGSTKECKQPQMSVR